MDFRGNTYYRKLVVIAQLLRQSNKTLREAGFALFYLKIRRRLKQYFKRFQYAERQPVTYPPAAATVKTYIRLRDFQMKADNEAIGKKLKTIREEIAQKTGV